MKVILDIFNNRELALILWGMIFIVSINFSKNIRASFKDVIKSDFDKDFLKVYFLIGIYLIIIFYSLNLIGVWNKTDTKDSLIWFFTIAILMVFRLNSTTKINDFKKLFIDNFKAIVLVEFIINLYSFNLLVEFIILPVMVFLTMLKTASERDEKNLLVTNALQNTFIVFGAFILIYSAYKTILVYDSVINITTLKSFALPIILPILFIPFQYLLSIYSIYESFFVRIDFMTTKKDKIKIAKKAIKKTALLNLKKLNSIRERFDKRVFYEDVNLTDYIKQISK